MNLLNLQIIVLATSLSFMLAQLLVRQKRAYHILFAMFCGSIALTVVKQLSGASLGDYKYLIGMAACVTCNGYWLLSRSVFRGKNSIGLPHIVLACVIATLIMLNQGYRFAISSHWFEQAQDTLFSHALSELTTLLSSCILVLSFWEGCRGFTQSAPVEKMQRVLFLMTFGTAVTVSKLSQSAFTDNQEWSQITTTCITLFVLFNTQILLAWRTKTVEHASSVSDSATSDYKSESEMNSKKANKLVNSEDSELVQQLQSLVIDKQLFLQTNLKIADAARALNVSEYRVSNAIRHNLQARNFNQYINQLRVEHACKLLSDTSIGHWSVLVISLESGFASVGPFTRAFKASTGLTPNQYRLRAGQLKRA